MKDGFKTEEDMADSALKLNRRASMNKNLAQIMTNRSNKLNFANPKKY